MTCGWTKMKKKKQKDCMRQGIRGRMRKWLGRHQEHVSMARLGRGEREREESEWRLEAEEEADVPEIIIVSDAVEGTPVDLEGERRHERVEAKLSRRERSTKRRG